jgi:hypothetical protein
VLSKSGLDGPDTGSDSAEPLSEGAAFTFDEDDDAVFIPGFFRLTDVGTNAVASFFKSRSSGSTERVAAATLASEGLRPGKVTAAGLEICEDWADRLSRWAWKVWWGTDDNGSCMDEVDCCRR